MLLELLGRNRKSELIVTGKQLIKNVDSIFIKDLTTISATNMPHKTHEMN